MKVKSYCGASDLMAAISGRDPDTLRLKLGLPTKKTWYHCLNCEKRTLNKFYCSYQCQSNYAWISVECSECHKSFKIQQSQLIARTKRHKISEIFCSKSCYGRWFGRNFGFAKGWKLAPKK